MSNMITTGLVMALASGTAAAQATTTPPNILMAVVDDLGWNDVGWRSDFKQIKTPKLDKFVQTEAAILTNYYVYRFCSPSRSTFMTGRYPWHIGQQTRMNLNPTPGIACGINLKYDFLPKMLKQKGYATWALGKWHLGFLTPQFTPTGRGFDSYVGYYSGAEEHFTHLKAGLGLNVYDLSNNTAAGINGKTQSINPLLKDVGNASATYSSYVYGNETLRLLAAHDVSVPLFIYLAWNNVHAPCEAPDNYLAPNSEIQDKGRRGLAGMMSALDDQLPAVIDGFKSKGIWNNTIMIFTTDNGGNLGGSGCNYPLRGGKYTFWQGGVRGNAFVSGGLLPQFMRGSHWAGAAHAADWYTTFAAMAGASVDNTGPLPADGVALWDAIASNKSSPRTEVVLQIMSNSSDNMFEEPDAEWCKNAGEGDIALCHPPVDGTGWLSRGKPPAPPRPYPAMGPCNSTMVTNVTLNSSFKGSICSANGVCMNVQRGQDHIIWYNAVIGANSEFSYNPNSKVIHGEDTRCLKFVGVGKQIMFDSCGSKGTSGFTYDDNAKMLYYTDSDNEKLCTLYVPDGPPPPPPGPVGLELGAIIQGQWKLISGYPGWKVEWDGWPQPPQIDYIDGEEAVSNGSQFCVDQPCLFDIFADPTEHHDVSSQHPEIVTPMLARLNELVKGEVTLKASNLCPTPIGTKGDERSAASAKQLGFWEPWLPPLPQ